MQAHLHLAIGHLWHHNGRGTVGHRRTRGREREAASEWQGEEEDIIGYTDSDWAGCRTTGESTSGGSLCIGSHFIKG